VTVTSSKFRCAAPISNALNTNTNNHEHASINHNHQSTIYRSKHSKTQIKRKFQHPASLRVAARNETYPGQGHAAPPTPSSDLPHFVPRLVLPNGWSEPPTEENCESVAKYEEIVRKRDALGFKIGRTKNKPRGAVGFLPVYSNFRIGGTKKTTIIRKIKGDKERFLQELKAELSISPDDTTSIIWRGSGTSLEVNGNRNLEIKQFLARLGF
jgi:hypothetical protein